MQLSIAIATLLVAILLLPHEIFASNFRLDNWKSHTSVLDVLALDIDHKERIWAGSSGGVFVYDTKDKSYTTYNNINAILSNEITTIKAYPERELVMLGTFDGFIEVFTPEGEWQHITDIYSQQFSNPRINDIAFTGNKAYIAGGFGLAIFDLDRNVFLETVRKLGNFPNQTPINKLLLHEGTIWAATEVGVAKADMNEQLSNPAVWTSYDVHSGLNELRILDVVYADNAVLVMTEKHIKKFQNNSFVDYVSSIDRLISIKSVDNALAYTNWFWFKVGNDYYYDVKHPGLINGFEYYTDSKGNIVYVFYYKEFGIGIFLNDSLYHFLPNSPLTNNFRSMTVDKDANLWLATTHGFTSKGFAKYDGKNWRNFTASEYPQLRTNEYHKIFTHKDNIYISNYGAGLLKWNKKDSITDAVLYNQENSVLRGLSDSPGYVVIGEAEVDKNDVVWMACLGTISPGPSLVAITPDGKSYGFTNPQNPNVRQFMTLAIDFNGTKWVGGTPVHGVGLMYFNERNTLENPADDVRGMLSVSAVPNLLENIHSALVVDKVGTVWIGTAKGVSVIVNPSAVLSNSSNLIVRTLNRLLGEINVNDIVVDAQNNKWIATTDGVWVVDADGGQVLAYINSENSPLSSDDVFALGYDGTSGKMYFSTRMGVYEAQTLSVEPAKQYDIFCYPQPFDPVIDGELVIDGLVEYSEIKILTSDGSFVRKLSTGSRKVMWDGKDETGNAVSNGIYLVVATSMTTKENSVQKVAVIRRN